MEAQYTPPGKCRFTPLYGASVGSPICYLLQINDFTVLLDCGWNDSFDVKLLQPVIDVVGSVDAVLLSHPDTCHLGALPYLVGKCGLKAPVYATYPVFKMGQMFMYDHCHSRRESEDFDLFTLDDVDEAFRAVVRVRYHQTLKLKGKGSGISITAYAAGHTLGGSVWRMKAHEEEVVYAMDYNHAKEHHLNGTSLQQLFSRPTLMVTDSAGADYKAPDRAKRDSKFFELILGNLRKDGSVLIPVDTAGRVLELMLLLDKYWNENKLVYPLVLLSSVAPTMVQFAKSCLDWLNDNLAKAFQYNLENPFNLKYMKLCANRDALGALPQGPKVVLASTPSLDSGLSRTLFFEWASNPRNLLIFTSPPEPNTLAATLLERARKAEQQQKQQKQQQRQKQQAPPHRSPPQQQTGGEDMEVDSREREALVVKMKMSRRVFLEGEELEQWLEEKELERTGGVKKMEVDTDTEAVAGTPRGRSGSLREKPLRTSSGALAHLGRTSSGHLQSDQEEVGACPPGPDVLLDGFTPPPDAVAPMFPDEDEPFKVGWDQYGAQLEEWEFKSSTALAGGEAAEPAEEAPPPPERPTKIVTVDANVHVNAQIQYFDYEGRSDGFSVSTFLTQIAPQHLVLLHGKQHSTQRLAEYCHSELQQLCTAIHRPGDGEVVEIDLTPSFPTLLSDGLMAGVHPHGLGAYSLAWVEGILRQFSQSEPPLLESAAARAVSGVSNHGGIFIGDVKLSDVKQALEARHMDAHFGFGGTLVCQGGQVLIKKGEQSGHLVLEGAMTENYYRVRDALYAQYNIC